MKKMFILIFLLIPISTFAVSDEQLAKADITLYLDFNEASYYEFGFSTTPVNSGNDDPTPVNIGTPLLSTAEGGIDANHIESAIRPVYAYWNVVSPSAVTLYLKMDGKLVPENAPEGYDGGIDWTVSRVAEDVTPAVILNSATNDNEETEFIIIEPTLSTTSGVNASERVGSVELQIHAEYTGDVDTMIAGTYTGELTLGVVSNG